MASSTICPAHAYSLLVNYRPGYVSSYLACERRVHRELAIQPFREENAGKILDAILGVGADAGAPAAVAVRPTDGNPFFLEECVRTLVRAGHS
jgi:hypothetical protein